MSESNNEFKIIGSDSKLLKYIPWNVMQLYENQAIRNHKQDLQRLHERGGLSLIEALAVLEGRSQYDDKYHGMTSPQALWKVMEIIVSTEYKGKVWVSSVYEAVQEANDNITKAVDAGYAKGMEFDHDVSYVNDKIDMLIRALRDRKGQLKHLNREYQKRRKDVDKKASNRVSKSK